jgi:hypothetical protein
MAKKIKNIPLNATSANDSKKVKSATQSPDRSPSWRFSTVDKGGMFAWPCNIQTELEIVQKLHGFDSMLWSEIEGKIHHAILKSSLSKEAQKRRDEIKQEDVDEVFSFHLSGKERIFCIRAGGVAKLLWHDPEHQVCLSKKKHT